MIITYLNLIYPCYLFHINFISKFTFLFRYQGLNQHHNFKLSHSINDNLNLKSMIMWNHKYIWGSIGVDFKFYKKNCQDVFL